MTTQAKRADELPPYDLDAEKAVLGSILMAPEHL